MWALPGSDCEGEGARTQLSVGQRGEARVWASWAGPKRDDGLLGPGKREMESEGEVGQPDVAQEGEGEGFPFSFCKFIL